MTQGWSWGHGIGGDTGERFIKCGGLDGEIRGASLRALALGRDGDGRWQGIKVVF